MSRILIAVLGSTAIAIASSTAIDRDAMIAFKQARSTVNADSAAVMYKAIVEQFPRDTISAWAMLRLAQYAAARGEQSDVEQNVIRLRELFPTSAARSESVALLPERPVDEPLPPRSRTTSKPAAATAPTPPVTARPVEATSTSYSVQLGAFGVKANAMRMQSLIPAEYKSTVTERSRASGALYIVTAGSFPSTASAEEALTALEKSTGVRGVVVKR